MISLNQFIEETKGKRIGVPWNANLTGQCVSLIQQYVGQCLGQPMKARGNAQDWDENYVRAGLGYIVKYPTRGDIIVYNFSKLGHIAIFIDFNTMYDQNNYSHDGGRAGYAKLMKGGVYIRPYAKLISEDEFTPGVYHCNCDLYIRKSPNGDHTKVKDCTKSMRRALTRINPNANAVIRKGTNITALSIANVNGTSWLRNYSGYVCVKGKINYCSKVNS